MDNKGSGSKELVKVTEERLSATASDVIDLVLKKNADYGDAWQRQGLAGALVRLTDKFFRLETLADGREALVVNEAIEDTLMDVVGYGLLGLLYVRQKEVGK